MTDRPGRQWLRLAVSVVLGVGLVAAIWPYMAAMPERIAIPAWVVPAYLGALVPFHLLRAIRWWWLVRGLGPVPARDALAVGLAGYMWIAALPLRIGELARPLLLAERNAIPVARSLGVVAVERVVDGLLVCGMFFAGAAGTTLGDSHPTVRAVAWTTMALFAGGLVLLVVLGWRPAGLGAAVQAGLGRAAPRLADAVSGFATSIGEGLRQLPRTGALVWFLLVTLAYWVCNVAGMWLLARGVGLPLSLAGATVLTAVMNLVLVAPGGPAQLGTFQGGVALGLALLVPDEVVRVQGSVFAFVLYLAQLGSIVVLGIVAQRSLAVRWDVVLGRRAAEVS
ncbi:MAG TPA: lysylphosphatidylglycerol synthase transmembrane domain-containing protein [Nannocystaceae bacterium]|nr:lysylphosphatidylglycerol synthase transmembrane domain-containing protein [Nannocystaceae bacterium]